MQEGDEAFTSIEYVLAEQLAVLGGDDPEFAKVGRGPDTRGWAGPRAGTGAATLPPVFSFVWMGLLPVRME